MVIGNTCGTVWGSVIFLVGQPRQHHKGRGSSTPLFMPTPVDAKRPRAQGNKRGEGRVLGRGQPRHMRRAVCQRQLSFLWYYCYCIMLQYLPFLYNLLFLELLNNPETV